MKGLIYIIYISHIKQRKKYNNTHLFVFVRIALYKLKPISLQDCEKYFFNNYKSHFCYSL